MHFFAKKYIWWCLSYGYLVVLYSKIQTQKKRESVLLTRPTFRGLRIALLTERATQRASQ